MGTTLTNSHVQVVTEKGALQTFDLEGREIALRSFTGPGIVNAVTFDQSGQTAVIRRGSSVTVWETNTNVDPRNLEGLPTNFAPATGRLELEPSGRYLAVMGVGATQVIDLTTRMIVGQTTGGTDQLFFTSDEIHPIRRQNDRLLGFTNALPPDENVTLPRGTRFVRSRPAVGGHRRRHELGD